jgi:hypothetical protein
MIVKSATVGLRAVAERVLRDRDLEGKGKDVGPEHRRRCLRGGEQAAGEGHTDNQSQHGE